MSHFTQKLRKEFRALLAPTVFFLTALHLIAFARGLLLDGTGITLASEASVTIAALIMAKAVLLADLLPFVAAFHHKPLAWSIAWKSAFYVLVATFLHYLERLLHFWRKAEGLGEANARLLADMVWPHFWGIQIFVAILVLFYCTTSELIRVIGKDRALQILFGRGGRSA